MFQGGGFLKRRRSPFSSLGLLPVLLTVGALGLCFLLHDRDVRSGAYLVGDCPYYASAAVSLWVDGDVNLSNQLLGGLVVHQKQVALGRHGEWFPKHPLLLSVLSVPFYALFGIPGFLLLNALVMLLLVMTLWRLCRRHAAPGIAMTATLLVFAGSFLRNYLYEYSPDLLSTLLVLVGLLLILSNRAFSGGLFLGLSVLAKVTNLFVAALVVLFLFFRRPRRDAIAAGAGLLPGIAAWSLLNLALFGSPTTTGYDRTLVFRDGSVTTVSHKGFFDVPVWVGARGQLLDPKAGLLFTAPILLLALPGLLPYVRKAPWESLLVLGLSEFLFLFFSTYRWWAASRYGNRFLMVPVCLAAIPISLALESFWRTIETRFHARIALPEAPGER
ncbi:MAG TPA: glycosyltransferase 87 family protein [Candidatus Polarisedimenticolia bacterium]|nr:glycosyltransferase 87 family protein [Candidatus Polarisedimenticolia bacterium]